MPGTGVHFAWNPCSHSPESMFTIPGIRVHDALEWLFTFGWNQRSPCPGIPILAQDGVLISGRASRQRSPQLGLGYGAMAIGLFRPVPKLGPFEIGHKSAT